MNTNIETFLRVKTAPIDTRSYHELNFTDTENRFCSRTRKNVLKKKNIPRKLDDQC